MAADRSLLAHVVRPLCDRCTDPADHGQPPPAIDRSVLALQLEALLAALEATGHADGDGEPWFPDLVNALSHAACTAPVVRRQPGARGGADPLAAFVRRWRTTPPPPADADGSAAAAPVQAPPPSDAGATPASGGDGSAARRGAGGGAGAGGGVRATAAAAASPTVSVTLEPGGGASGDIYEVTIQLEARLPHLNLWELARRHRPTAEFPQVEALLPCVHRPSYVTLYNVLRHQAPNWTLGVGSLRRWAAHIESLLAKRPRNAPVGWPLAAPRALDVQVILDADRQQVEKLRFWNATAAWADVSFLSISFWLRVTGSRRPFPSTTPCPTTRCSVTYASTRTPANLTCRSVAGSSGPTYPVWRPCGCTTSG